MTVLSDKTLLQNYTHMVTPFISQKIKTVMIDGAECKVFSYGLGHGGYDVRCGREFKRFKPDITIIDPKLINDSYFELIHIQSGTLGEYIELPPFGFCLACTIEYIRMPLDVIGLMTNKSSYVRTALLQPSTVLEPGWEGQITIELSNLTNKTVRVYVGEGIAQILFLPLDQAAIVGYGAGKYQAQTGVTPTRM